MFMLCMFLYCGQSWIWFKWQNNSRAFATGNKTNHTLIWYFSVLWHIHTTSTALHDFRFFLGSNYETTHGCSCFKTYHLAWHTTLHDTVQIKRSIRPYHLAWHGSNKAVHLSFNQRWSGNLVNRFQACHVNGWRFTSRLGALHFCNSDCLYV